MTILARGRPLVSQLTEDRYPPLTAFDTGELPGGYYLLAYLFYKEKGGRVIRVERW